MICVVNPCGQTGCRRGRVDAFVCVLRDILTTIRTREPRSLVCVYVCVRPQTEVQSTDKNFMVPVGGAIVAGPSSTLVDKACNLALAVLLVPRAMCMDLHNDSGVRALSGSCIHESCVPRLLPGHKMPTASGKTLTNSSCAV